MKTVGEVKEIINTTLPRYQFCFVDPEIDEDEEERWSTTGVASSKRQIE